MRYCIPVSAEADGAAPAGRDAHDARGRPRHRHFHPRAVMLPRRHNNTATVVRSPKPKPTSLFSYPLTLSDPPKQRPSKTSSVLDVSCTAIGGRCRRRHCRLQSSFRVSMWCDSARVCQPSRLSQRDCLLYVRVRRRCLAAPPPQRQHRTLNKARTDADGRARGVGLRTHTRLHEGERYVFSSPVSLSTSVEALD